MYSNVFTFSSGSYLNLTLDFSLVFSFYEKFRLLVVLVVEISLFVDLESIDSDFDEKFFTFVHIFLKIAKLSKTFIYHCIYCTFKLFSIGTNRLVFSSASVALNFFLFLHLPKKAAVIIFSLFIHVFFFFFGCY